MDILPLPQRPVLPVPKTPYLGKEIWDCGPFFSYANRRQLLRIVPHSLRRPDRAIEVPYLELIHPTPREELGEFLQTWFFFGLIAECLGFNEPDNEESLVRSIGQANCQRLYDRCVVQEDGKKYISGTKVLSTFGPFLDGLLTPEISVESAASFEERLRKLRECIRFTWELLSSIYSDYDRSIKFSIGALCELITSSLSIGVVRLSVGGFSVEFSAVPHAPWMLKYLAPGSQLEQDMLESGWCISEIERIRQGSNRLATAHYLSRLDHSVPSRNHSSCTKIMCKAFQINMATYELSHATSGCECPEYPIKVDDVQNILRNTEFYPILRFDYADDGHVGLAVEEYRPGLQYIALSHVSPGHKSLP
jgi:hypothetical protein